MSRREPAIDPNYERQLRLELPIGFGWTPFPGDYRPRWEIEQGMRATKM